MSAQKESVTVRIAGEEHTIRSTADPEYTMRCAEYVDQRIQAVKEQTGLLENRKAAILAALSVTDELFQAHDDFERRNLDLGSRIDRLAERLERAVSAE